MSKRTPGTQNVLAAFVLLLCFAAHPLPARAWGSRGHHVVGTVAEFLVKRRTARAIAALLDPGESLATVSTLPDAWRDPMPETAAFHYVNTPVGSSYAPSRDCVETERGDCIVAAIDRSRTALRDTSLDRATRRVALIWLVHLYGDLSQPLHCSNDADYGGNAKRVCLEGTCYRDADARYPLTLHGVWDSELVENGTTESDYSRAILARAKSLTKAERRALTSGTLADYVNEANSVAADVAYGRLPQPDGDGVYDLGSDYATASRTAIDERLLVGALRLAASLDRAFKRR